MSSRSSKARYLLFPSSLLKCLRSFFMTKSRSALCFAIRNWRNSWWKCRLSCLSPFSSSSFQSRTLTLQSRCSWFAGWWRPSRIPPRTEANCSFCVSVEVFKVFSPGQGSTAPLGADLAGLQDFSPGQGSSALLDAPPEHFQGVFVALFPDPQKVRGSPRTRVRSCVRTQAHPR